MKILHVIQGMPKTAGTSVFAIEVAKEQIRRGNKVEIVYFTNTQCADDIPMRKVGALEDVGYIPDIVHIHAIWSKQLAKAIRWCHGKKVAFIVSPHGGLMSRVLGKNWLKKHVFFWFFIKPWISSAKAIHCTGDGEVCAIRRLGIRARTFVAPLGCHMPAIHEVKASDEGALRNVLFLGRLGEEKGLEFLLDAWKKVARAGWKLILAGPDWRGYGEVLKEKVAAEMIEGVEFTGAADDVMKDRLYRQADLFVLSSPTENFSMVVLDALAYGVPVICTKGTPWRCVEEARAGWWIEPNSDAALASSISEFMGMSADGCAALSRNARSIAKTYEWHKVVDTLEVEYVR